MNDNEIGCEQLFIFYLTFIPQTWMESTKEIRKQVPGAVYEFTFSVKFYPHDPAQLTEDLTRWISIHNILIKE